MSALRGREEGRRRRERAAALGGRALANPGGNANRGARGASGRDQAPVWRGGGRAGAGFVRGIAACITRGSGRCDAPDLIEAGEGGRGVAQGAGREA